MAEPLTREGFERARTAAATAGRRDGSVLAAFSVVAGVGQLIFLRWADLHLERGPKLAIALTGFIVYIAVVVVLLWRMERRKRALGPVCPQCGVRLQGLSERVAAATGRCDACGGVVIEGEHAARPSVGGSAGLPS